MFTKAITAFGGLLVISLALLPLTNEVIKKYARRVDNSTRNDIEHIPVVDGRVDRRRFLLLDVRPEETDGGAMHVAGEERNARVCYLGVACELDDEVVSFLFVTLRCPVIVLGIGGPENEDRRKRAR